MSMTDKELADFARDVATQLDPEEREFYTAPSWESRRALARAGLLLLSLVLDKNDAYGDSMRNPVEVFARGLDPATRIAVRMDDKINRMVRGQGREALGEDVILDLAGYCLGLLSLDRGDGLQ